MCVMWLLCFSVLLFRKLYMWHERTSHDVNVTWCSVCRAETWVQIHYTLSTFSRVKVGWAVDSDIIGRGRKGNKSRKEDTVFHVLCASMTWMPWSRLSHEDQDEPNNPSTSRTTHKHTTVKLKGLNTENRVNGRGREREREKPRDFTD